jgi:hypothetical protein
MIEVPRKNTGLRAARIVSVGLAIALGATAARGQSKFTSDKYKAVGKYARALATCHAKAVGAGVPVDPTCEAAGLAKLQASFVKAEGRGDCIITGEEAGAASASQSFVSDLGSILEKQLLCCQGGGLCLYATDFADCSTQGGTLGAPGTVCDGASGTCVAPPAGAGGCCEQPNWGTGCVGGQIDGAGCTLFGGTFTPNSICLPSGSCAP